jgi:hypothetical protein
MIARLGQLSLSCREIGLRRPQRVELVLRVQARHHLPGLDPIAELDVAVAYPSRDTERQHHFVLCFNAPCQRDRHAGLALLDRQGANRTGFRRGRLGVGSTRRAQCRQRQYRQHRLHIANVRRHRLTFRANVADGSLSNACGLRLRCRHELPSQPTPSIGFGWRA